jgi:hypothetical protein
LSWHFSVFPFIFAFFLLNLHCRGILAFFLLNLHCRGILAFYLHFLFPSAIRPLSTTCMSRGRMVVGFSTTCVISGHHQ